MKGQQKPAALINLESFVWGSARGSLPSWQIPVGPRWLTLLIFSDTHTTREGSHTFHLLVLAFYLYIFLIYCMKYLPWSLPLCFWDWGSLTWTPQNQKDVKQDLFTLPLNVFFFPAVCVINYKTPYFVHKLICVIKFKMFSWVKGSISNIKNDVFKCSFLSCTMWDSVLKYKKSIDLWIKCWVSPLKHYFLILSEETIPHQMLLFLEHIQDVTCNIFVFLRKIGSIILKRTGISFCCWYDHGNLSKYLG